MYDVTQYIYSLSGAQCLVSDGCVTSSQPCANAWIHTTPERERRSQPMPRTKDTPDAWTFHAGRQTDSSRRQTLNLPYVYKFTSEQIQHSIVRIMIHMFQVLVWAPKKESNQSLSREKCCKLWEARCRLYRSRIFKVNSHCHVCKTDFRSTSLHCARCLPLYTSAQLQTFFCFVELHPLAWNASWMFLNICLLLGF